MDRRDPHVPGRPEGHRPDRQCGHRTLPGVPRAESQPLAVPRPVPPGPPPVTSQQYQKPPTDHGRPTDGPSGRTRMREIYRILDANFNRAREALRVIEDCGRFVLSSSS
ncbi:MAG: hypothetical protein KGY81_06350, partial [Phycisphaerae bacterium]|nr:hypothetical protein [Phycisphaerae bacterium]